MYRYISEQNKSVYGKTNETKYRMIKKKKRQNNANHDPETELLNSCSINTGDVGSQYTNDALSVCDL